MTKKAVILYNKISENALQDELDVLDQVEEVEKSLHVLGYETYRETIDLNLQNTKDAINNINPDFVFNFVEAIDGKGELLCLSPALLESMRVPYTGCRFHAMYLTTNKVLAKEFLREKNIPTGEWFMPKDINKLSKDKRYIVKPIWEDGSVGIFENRIFFGDDIGITELFSKLGKEKYFIEEYIHGREFNLSIIGGENGPTVMPPAEIQFIGYPKDKPNILGYNSKWVEDSYEYNNTPRTFKFPDEDNGLLIRLKEICLECWRSFDLKGYARVDFRVDENSNPFVLEINANPCITPDAGFHSACKEGGLDYVEVVKRIIYDALYE